MNDITQILTQEEINLLDESMKIPRGRKFIIEKISVPYDDNWQAVNTPYDICKEMVDLVDSAEKFLVFFSMEFLEVLIHEKGISPDRIRFVADNKIEDDIAVVMYGVESVIFSKENKITPENIKNLGANMKFNTLAVVGNPPYQTPDAGDSTGAKPLYHLFVDYEEFLFLILNL
jgi:hypothetical protein